MSFIRDYCLGKFADTGRLCSDDRELTVPSLFLKNDWKKKMSINLENGLWRCFKSGETGNFVKLYSLLEGCSYREAYEKFVFEDFLSKGTLRHPSQVEEFNPNEIVSDLEDAKDFEVVEDHPFVLGRDVADFPFYIAKRGKYAGRLIIPFLNRFGKLFYFQARALHNELPKYLNCKNLKSSQVLYPFEYDSYEPLYVTEGVFDCLSMKKAGLNATTTLSCFTSREQILQLAQYQGPVVCAYDSDGAGLEGIGKFMKLGYWVKMDNLRMVTPEGAKDWNELLLAKGVDAIKKVADSHSELNSLNLQMLSYNKRKVV